MRRAPGRAPAHAVRRAPAAAGLQAASEQYRALVESSYAEARAEVGAAAHPVDAAHALCSPAEGAVCRGQACALRADPAAVDPEAALGLAWRVLLFFWRSL